MAFVFGTVASRPGCLTSNVPRQRTSRNCISEDLELDLSVAAVEVLAEFSRRAARLVKSNGNKVLSVGLPRSTTNAWLEVQLLHDAGLRDFHFPSISAIRSFAPALEFDESICWRVTSITPKTAPKALGLSKSLFSRGNTLVVDCVTKLDLLSALGSAATEPVQVVVDVHLWNSSEMQRLIAAEDQELELLNFAGVHMDPSVADFREAAKTRRPMYVSTTAHDLESVEKLWERGASVVRIPFPTFSGNN